MTELTMSSSMENAPPAYFINFFPPGGLVETILVVTRRQAAASSCEALQAGRESWSRESRNRVMHLRDSGATRSSSPSSLTRLTIQQWTASSALASLGLTSRVSCLMRSLTEYCRFEMFMLRGERCELH